MTVYLDHNATTPLDPVAESAMAPFWRDRFGNPSSLHAVGEDAAAALAEARARLAAAIGAGDPSAVAFCSGATEALNQVILTTALARPGSHLIASRVEHPAVRNPLEWLAEHGHQVTWLPVDRHGRIDPREVAAALRSDTTLVCCQLANNEVGTVQPVAQVAAVMAEHPARLLVDAVQGLGKLALSVDSLGADAVAFSAHKVGGPRGVGALWLNPAATWSPLLRGGGQEHGLRPGTENVVGAVGFAVAAERAVARQPELARRWLALRDELLVLTELLPEVRLNGHPSETLANTISLCFGGVDAVALTLALSERGIAVSPGAACCGRREPASAVLQAMGLSAEQSAASVRFSLGADTSPWDLKYVREQVVELVTAQRQDGPAAGAGCRLGG